MEEDPDYYIFTNTIKIRLMYSASNECFAFTVSCDV